MQYAFKGGQLTADEGIQIWQKANPEERMLIGTSLAKKIMRQRKKIPNDKDLDAFDKKTEPILDEIDAMGAQQQWQEEPEATEAKAVDYTTASVDERRSLRDLAREED
jgi:hypothetical protein